MNPSHNDTTFASADLTILGILCDRWFSQNQNKHLPHEKVSINPYLIGYWALPAHVEIVGVHGHNVPSRISFWQQEVGYDEKLHQSEW